MERGGALFVPHRINEFAVKVVRRRVDLVVFAAILRFSLGFNRPAARLSHSFVAQWTGLHAQNVRRGLLNLKKMGLVNVLISPTSSTSTVYEVPIVRGYLEWRRIREEDALRGTHFKPSNTGVYSNQAVENNQPNYSGAISPITKKENLKKTGNLSQRDNFLPHKIKSYIAGVRPHQKRVDEEYHLQQLLIDYPVDDIVESLDYLQAHGALETGERVHSPMKYLCFAAEDVIAQVSKEKSRIARSEDLRQKLEQDQEQEELRRHADAQEMADALAAFSTLASAEQKRHIDDFKNANYAAGIAPPEKVTYNLAAKHWFQSARKM